MVVRKLEGDTECVHPRDEGLRDGEKRLGFTEVWVAAEKSQSKTSLSSV